MAIEVLGPVAVYPALNLQGKSLPLASRGELLSAARSKGTGVFMIMWALATVTKPSETMAVNEYIMLPILVPDENAWVMDG